MEWNPWHGCIRYSEGCQNCYVYRRDASVGRDASALAKNRDFDLPLRKKRDGSWVLPPGAHVMCCMTSDFFLEGADAWRGEAWQMIRERSDVRFTIITKRILRFLDCVPRDWGAGYPNVTLLCTMENQRRCDERFPVFNEVPARRKAVICEPLLGEIDMSRYLHKGIAFVSAGGESGSRARLCDYDWVLSLAAQCARAGVGFHFKQTGALFRKDGRVYRIPRQLQHGQAKKAGIDRHHGPLW